MRTPMAFELQPVDQPGASTDRVAKVRAHACFRGARLLLVVLVFSIAIWAGVGWGLSALVN